MKWISANKNYSPASVILFSYIRNSWSLLVPLRDPGKQTHTKAAESHMSAHLLEQGIKMTQGDDDGDSDGQDDSD